MKFTKEIKDNWLKALKSGDYRQGFLALHNKASNTYCCIGVLAEITPELACEPDSDSDSPYQFLTNTIGRKAMEELVIANDACATSPYPANYSTVIPLVEALPTQD